MRTNVRSVWLFAAATLGLTLPGWPMVNVFAQDASKAAVDAPKTAEQQYKNIQVLKDVPGEQLIPSMQFIAVSMGVECEFCHVERQMDKNDKREKKTARKMIAMELAITKGHFEANLKSPVTPSIAGQLTPWGLPF